MYPIQRYNYVPPEGMHMHTTLVKTAKHETSFSLVYWFLGGEKAGKLSDFLIQHSPFARACLDIGQSAEADEAEFH